MRVEIPKKMPPLSVGEVVFVAEVPSGEVRSLETVAMWRGNLAVTVNRGGLKKHIKDRCRHLAYIPATPEMIAEYEREVAAWRLMVLERIFGEVSVWFEYEGHHFSEDNAKNSAALLGDDCLRSIESKLTPSQGEPRGK